MQLRRVEEIENPMLPTKRESYYMEEKRRANLQKEFLSEISNKRANTKKTFENDNQKRVSLLTT